MLESTAVPTVRTTRSRRGTQLVGVGALMYAAAAVAPFTQGLVIADGNPTVTHGYSQYGTASGVEAFHFLWNWGWSGAGRYLQAATVVAMAVVAMLAVVRLHRGGSQRSIGSTVVIAATGVYLASQWASPPQEPVLPAPYLPVESFRFTTSLAVATAGLLVAATGVGLTWIRSDR
jgi:hypothetical protein